MPKPCSYHDKRRVRFLLTIPKYQGHFYKIYGTRVVRSEHWAAIIKLHNDIREYTYTSKFLDDIKASSTNEAEFLKELDAYADWMNTVITKDFEIHVPVGCFFLRTKVIMSEENTNQ